MKYVFIFWIYATYGVSVSSATFESEKTCNAALQAWKDKGSFMTPLDGICTPQ
jgi:hypothetical protein